LKRQDVKETPEKVARGDDEMAVESEVDGTSDDMDVDNEEASEGAASPARTAGLKRFEGAIDDLARRYEGGDCDESIAVSQLGEGTDESSPDVSEAEEGSENEDEEGKDEEGGGEGREGEEEAWMEGAGGAAAAQEEGVTYLMERISLSSLSGF
jgi:hypothetical protein